MDDTNPELQRGPEVHTWHYPPPMRCTECGGAGSIALLVTARRCGACEGSGWVHPPARHEFTPAPLGYYRRKRSFDEQGRLICQVQWFEPVEGAAPREAGNPTSGTQNKSEGEKEK